jgi:hypothetical protein
LAICQNEVKKARSQRLLNGVLNSKTRVFQPDKVFSQDEEVNESINICIEQGFNLERAWLGNRQVNLNRTELETIVSN